MEPQSTINKKVVQNYYYFFQLLQNEFILQAQIDKADAIEFKDDDKTKPSIFRCGALI